VLFSVASLEVPFPAASGVLLEQLSAKAGASPQDSNLEVYGGYGEVREQGGSELSDFIRSFFRELRKGIDSLLPVCWQYVSAAIFAAVAYAVSGAGQHDSGMAISLEACAGLLAGPVVVACLRYLGRPE